MFFFCFFHATYFKAAHLFAYCFCLLSLNHHLHEKRNCLNHAIGPECASFCSLVREERKGFLECYSRTKRPDCQWDLECREGSIEEGRGDSSFTLDVPKLCTTLVDWLYSMTSSTRTEQLKVISLGSITGHYTLYFLCSLPVLSEVSESKLVRAWMSKVTEWKVNINLMGTKKNWSMGMGGRLVRWEKGESTRVVRAWSLRQVTKKAHVRTTCT